MSDPGQPDRRGTGAQSSSPRPDRRRRRIDRVAAPDYLEGVAGHDPAALRAMRDECREEEARLSFARRLVQARLDILRAEVARRAEGGTGGLLDALPGILADDPRPTTLGGTRAVPLYTPQQSDSGERRRVDDELLEDASLGQLPELDDAQLAELVDRLGGEERRISGIRRRVLDNLDGLQAELIQRYQSGGVAVDDIVSTAVGRAAQGG